MARLRVFGPDGALKFFVGAAVLMMGVGEEIEVGVAGDFGMGGEKGRELRIPLGAPRNYLYLS